MNANGNGQLSPERLAALAAGCLLIDDARLYGLIDGGPSIDRVRCRAVLDRLEAEGIVPEQDEISNAALELLAELGQVRA